NWVACVTYGTASPQHPPSGSGRAGRSRCAETPRGWPRRRGGPLLAGAGEVLQRGEEGADGNSGGALGVVAPRRGGVERRAGDVDVHPVDVVGDELAEVRGGDGHAALAGVGHVAQVGDGGLEALGLLLRDGHGPATLADFAGQFGDAVAEL